MLLVCLLRAICNRPPASSEPRPRGQSGLDGHFRPEELIFKTDPLVINHFENQTVSLKDNYPLIGNN